MPERRRSDLNFRADGAIYVRIALRDRGAECCARDELALRHPPQGVT